MATPQSATGQSTATPVVSSQPTRNSSTMPPPPPPPFRESKKRPLDTVNFPDSPFFKMRLVLKDLRPLFLEVIRSPEFRDCKAAHDIQEKMKLMLDFCREMAVETTPITKCSNTHGSQNLSGEKQDGQKPTENQQNMRPAELAHVDQTTMKPAGKDQQNSGNNSENGLAADGAMKGTYIVGGSPVGWNFIMFHGSGTVYYGRTKESFRATRQSS